MITVKKASDNLSMDKVLEGLDKEQYEAVTSDINANTLCVAIAGSGKTHVLTKRVAYLIANGVDPSSIMLTTFTVKASKEMTERVSKMLDIKGKTPIVSGTFHSIASKYLRRYAEAIGYTKSFTILDTDDSASLIAGIRTDFLEERKDIPKKEFPSSKSIFNLHSKMINLEEDLYGLGVKPEEYIPYIELIHREYNRIKRESNSMDFDDMLVNFVKILRIETIRREIQNEIKYVLGDEYQDVNYLQEEIIRLISNKERAFVVGDPSQSIYAFRGSMISFINDFPKTYNANVRVLKTNYRSDKNVLSLAENAINKNQQESPVEMRAFKDTDHEQSLEEYYTNFDEINSIVNNVKDLLAKGEKPNEVSILIRSTGINVSQLEIAFRRNKIDYELRAGFSYFDRKHIKDLIAAATLLVNPKCSVSFKRVMALHKGVGEKTIAKIYEHYLDSNNNFNVALFSIGGLDCSKKAKQSVISFYETMVKVQNEKIVAEQLRLLTEYYLPIFESKCKNEEDYEEKATDIRSFPTLIEASSLDDFLEEIVLDSDKNKEKSTEDKVIISTMHRAKGLEFNHVFLPFMYLGNFPRKMDVPIEVIEEERRLFYVALTRAKKQLYISYPKSVNYDTVRPSPFLRDMM